MEWTLDRVGPGLNQHEADALGVAVACLTASEAVSNLLDPQAAKWRRLAAICTRLR